MARALLIAAFLRCNPPLAELDLREMDLSAQEVDTIAAALPYALSLTAIDCRQNASMGEEAASRLVDLIGSNTAPIRSFCGVGGGSS